MPDFPRTGCSVIAVRNDRVLLVKRGKEPYKGYWSLPGGAQELGETLEECARRELTEETGLVAKKLEFAAIRDRMTRDQNSAITHHYVLASFIALDVRGTAIADDDADAAEWFTFAEMEDLHTTPDTPKFVQDMLAKIGWHLEDTELEQDR